MRIGLALVFGLLAWEFGPTTVKGIGAIVLGAIALVTGAGGFCLLDRVFARRPSATAEPVGPLQAMLRSSHTGMVWLAARLWVGWIWLDAGWGKVQDSAWVGSEAGTAINGFLTSASSDRMTNGPFPPVSDWYAWLTDNVFLKIDTAGSLRAGENPLMLTYSILFLVAGAATYRYGVDRALIPRVHKAWDHRRWFTHHRPPSPPIAH